MEDTMRRIFERRDSNLQARVNRSGKKVEIYPNSRLELNKISGASVKFISTDTELQCIAKIPETNGTFSWRYRLDELECSLRDINQSVESLEDVVNELRIAANGKL